MAKPNSVRARVGAGAVTLRQVADRAGVTAITVSRALRAPESVAPPLLKAIMQAVDALGYVRNRFAGSLASASSPVVALIVPALDSITFIQVVDSVQAGLIGSGYEVLLGVTRHDLEREADLISTLLGWSPAGLIVVGGRHLPRARRMLEAFRAPLVEIAELAAPTIDMTVGMSHVRAGAAMGVHLIARGRREIGFVGGELNGDYRVNQRFLGLDRVLAAAGLRRRSPFKHPERPGARLGGDMLISALDADPALDALFFANDDLAISAILRADREGIAVPERVAIAGFNGFETTALTTPSLTTISTPRQAAGTAAVRKLLARIHGQDPGPSRVDLGFELIVREST